MNEQDIIRIVRQVLAETPRGVASHRHDGADSPQIDPAFFLGFPTYSAAPTHDAPDGTVVLSDVAGTRKIHGRIGGVWYGVTIT